MPRPPHKSKRRGTGPVQQKIIQILREAPEPLCVAEIAQQGNISTHSVRSALSSLYRLNVGIVYRQVERGGYLRKVTFYHFLGD